MLARPAARIANVRYAIRNIVAEAAKLEAQGRRILYCNIGDPLKFDFATPPHLIEAVHRAMREGRNGYAPSAGLSEARAAVAREAASRGLTGVVPEDVLITTGASEAIEMCLTALIEPGDGVLLPSPGYPLYGAVAAKLSAKAISYHLDEERGWALDLEEIEAKAQGAKAIIICNPNNPTGGQYSRRSLEGLLEIARRKGLVVLSDEIYDRLCYGEPPPSTASLAGDVPILSFNGLSKAYLACGWRVGWVVFHNSQLTRELRAAVQRLADARLCSPAPPQEAVAPALEGPQDFLQGAIAKLRERRDITVRRLNAIPGISVVEPQGTFYAMARINLPEVKDDEEFVLELLRETGVLFVHGSGFGQKEGTRHFRVVFLPPPAVLHDAFDRLDGFIKARYRR